MSFSFKLNYVNLQCALCSNKITMSWCLIPNAILTGWESQSGKMRIQHLFFPLIFTPPQVEVLSLSGLVVEKPFYTSSLCQWGNPIFIIETRLFDYSSEKQATSRCSTTSFVLAGTVVFPRYAPFLLPWSCPSPPLAQQFPWELSQVRWRHQRQSAQVSARCSAASFCQLFWWCHKTRALQGSTVVLC